MPSSVLANTTGAWGEPVQTPELYDSATLASTDAAPGPRVVSVAYAASVIPNANTTDILLIGSLTGNITINAPTGTPKDGQTLRIRMSQDATGSRTLTWNSAFAFGTDITAAMDPSAASSKWMRIFEWNAAESKWWATGIVRGF